MAGNKKEKDNLPENSSPVCYQNDPDIQRDYLLPRPKIKKSPKNKQEENNEEEH